MRYPGYYRLAATASVFSWILFLQSPPRYWAADHADTGTVAGDYASHGNNWLTVTAAAEIISETSD